MKLYSSFESALAQADYQLDASTGIWSRPDFQGINYSDGYKVERRIEAVINSTSDLTVFSAELRSHYTDWASTYHLSSTRANILRPFQLTKNQDILEIGAGCGALTRYLGECGAHVLALEGSEGEHWAFLKPQRHKMPQVKQTDWPRNAIDFFILAELEKAKLKPSTEAGKTTLLRRVYLDLIGLPPSPTEVDAFLASKHPDAYERVVDTLLASPHYGERFKPATFGWSPSPRLRFFQVRLTTWLNRTEINRLSCR